MLKIYFVHTRKLLNFRICIYVQNILKFIFIDFSVFFQTSNNCTLNFDAYKVALHAIIEGGKLIFEQNWYKIFSHVNIYFLI